METECPVTYRGPSAVGYIYRVDDCQYASWLLVNSVRETHKRRRNPSRIANRQLQPRSHSPLSISRIIARKPRQRQPNNNIQARGHKEAAKIPHASRRRTDQNGITSSANHRENNRKHSPLLRAIRKVRHNNLTNRSQAIARDRQRLHLRHTPVPERLDDRRQERREAVQNHIPAELPDAK
jgi:hypothetical protein